MIAYKGFNKDLTCTKGKGTFRYEVGKTYKENKAKCANTGFHCVEEPIEVLTWYSDRSSRYCVVEAGGDINEDGDERISCTEMTIMREITLQHIGIIECQWIMDHPNRECSRHVQHEVGEAGKDGIVVVRGKHPKAAGQNGSTIFLLKEGKGTREIERIGVFHIDGKDYQPDTYYRVDGRRAKCGKKN